MVFTMREKHTDFEVGYKNLHLGNVFVILFIVPDAALKKFLFL